MRFLALLAAVVSPCTAGAMLELGSEGVVPLDAGRIRAPRRPDPDLVLEIHVDYPSSDAHPLQLR